MAESINCRHCKKILNLGEIAVSNDRGELFCKTKHSPLEPGSCALKYLNENPEEPKNVYFFIRLGDK